MKRKVWVQFPGRLRLRATTCFCQKQFCPGATTRRLASPTRYTLLVLTTSVIVTLCLVAIWKEVCEIFRELLQNIESKACSNINANRRRKQNEKLKSKAKPSFSIAKLWKSNRGTKIFFEVQTMFCSCVTPACKSFFESLEGL